METRLLLTAYRKSPALHPMISSLTPYNLFLATILHDWHTIVRYEYSGSYKVNDFHVHRKSICDILWSIAIHP